MAGNISGLAVLVILSLGTAVLVWGLVRRSLRDLLDEVVRLPSATIFYSRLFLIGLLFLAIASAIGSPFDLPPEAKFMQYVWKVAGALSPLFALICLYTMGYLLLVTILVAVLRRRHDE